MLKCEYTHLKSKTKTKLTDDSQLKIYAQYISIALSSFTYSLLSVTLGNSNRNIYAYPLYFIR